MDPETALAFTCGHLTKCLFAVYIEVNIKCLFAVYIEVNSKYCTVL